MRRAAVFIVSIVVLGVAMATVASAQALPPSPFGGTRATLVQQFDSGYIQASQAQSLSSMSSFRVLMLSRWTSWGTDVLAQRWLRTSTFALRERTGRNR